MDLELNTIIIVICSVVAAVAVFYVTAYPYLSGDVKAEQRQAALTKNKKRVTADRSTDPAARRKQVADSLRDIENKHRAKKLGLKDRIAPEAAA